MYRFLDKNGTILYVGKAKDLKSRVSSYFSHGDLLGDKTRILVSKISKIKITIVESELEALLLEAFYIKKYLPKYNIRLTDNKAYLRIKITAKNKYPSVLLSRREDDDSSLYFGPYPNSGALKMVLKTIRRVFPYVSVANHPKRICLYHHLGLCPCPQVVALDEKSYRRNIKGIIKVLEGGSRALLKDMERKRNNFSRNEKFEKAAEVQKKIAALNLIIQPFHRPFEYDVNPNLRTDLRQQELQQLQQTLNTAGYYLTKLERIECYDISNIQGTNATGSMVVLTDGEIDKSQYRRFKIRRDWDKFSSSPNDFAMMKEVLKRRFRHDEWQWPDLLIVDGGKGQVSSAVKAFAELGIAIPLIGLAKREETIVMPNIPIVQNNLGDGSRMQQKAKDSELVPTLTFQEISLPKNSPALHLIMRIRDEAHRFAITYHRRLRSKYALAPGKPYT